MVILRVLLATSGVLAVLGAGAPGAGAQVEGRSFGAAIDQRACRSFEAGAGDGAELPSRRALRH